MLLPSLESENGKNNEKKKKKVGQARSFEKKRNEPTTSKEESLAPWEVELCHKPSKGPG